MRYLPHSASDRVALCAAVGVPDTDALFADVPEAARLKSPLPLPSAAGEAAVARAFQRWAGQNAHNQSHLSFLGAGIYNHHIPASVDALIQRGEFLTSYTPYQPEIAQGTLQYLFEFQTQVAELTGMEIANASLYDGSTACVEAVQMAMRVTGRRKALLSTGLHPEYRQVVETYAKTTGFQTSTSESLGDALTDDLACVVVQYPDFFGEPHDYRTLTAAAHAKGILVVAVVTEILALGLLEPPGIWGADIVAAEGQSLGNMPNLGGPHVGLFACRLQHLRQMPGRLCGETVDADGKRGFVLTLSTREQHIRRDKATSNICTNSGLCALAFTIHLSLLGNNGLGRLAEVNHAHACLLADGLAKLPGVTIKTKSFFNEFVASFPVSCEDIITSLLKKNILAGVPLARFFPHRPNDLLIAVTEQTDAAAIDAYIAAVKEVL
jgi:glycine dehydrogenase subunit 1